jgi:hypothetical protein
VTTAAARAVPQYCTAERQLQLAKLGACAKKDTHKMVEGQ